VPPIDAAIKDWPRITKETHRGITWVGPEVHGGQEVDVVLVMLRITEPFESRSARVHRKHWGFGPGALFSSGTRGRASAQARLAYIEIQRVVPESFDGAKYVTVVTYLCMWVLGAGRFSGDPRFSTHLARSPRNGRVDRISFPRPTAGNTAPAAAQS